MDTLKKAMMEKAGLTEEKATKAIDVMMAFLKDRLPEGVMDEVEMLVTAGNEEVDIAKDIDVFKIP